MYDGRKAILPGPRSVKTKFLSLLIPFLALPLLGIPGCSKGTTPVTAATTNVQLVASSPAAKKDPAVALAKVKLTALRFERDKDSAAAREGYNEALALDRDCALAYLHLGRLADSEERWEEALTNFNRFVQLDQTSDESIKTQLRIDDLKKLDEQDKVPGGREKRLYEAALTKARAAYQEGRHEEAAREAIAAVQIDANRYEGYVLQGSILARQEQFADAKPHLEKALSLAVDEQRLPIQAALDQCEKEIKGAALAQAGAEALDAKTHSLAQAKYAEAFALLPSRESWGLTAALAAGMAEDYYASKDLLQKLVNAQDATLAEQARSRLAKIEEMLTEREVQGMELRSKARSSEDLMQLGNNYMAGKDVPKDLRQAFACYQTAIKSDDWNRADNKVNALLFMEQVYLQGRGTPVNEVKARECFNAAAKLANIDDTSKTNSKYGAACFYGVRLRHCPKTSDWTSMAATNRAACLRLLNEAVDMGYRDYEHMSKDVDLVVLSADPDFQELVKRAKRLGEEEKALLAKKQAEERSRIAPLVKGVLAKYSRVLEGRKNRPSIGNKTYEFQDTPMWKIEVGESSFTISKDERTDYDDSSIGPTITGWSKQFTCLYTDLDSIVMGRLTDEGYPLYFNSLSGWTGVCAYGDHEARLTQLFKDLRAVGVKEAQ